MIDFNSFKCDSMKYAMLIFFILMTFQSDITCCNDEAFIDIEQLIKKRKIQFNKTDTKDIIQLFGHHFESSTSWSTARGIDREILSHSEFILYYYNDLDIEFVFKLNAADPSSKKSEPEYKLHKIKIYSCYKGRILSRIEMGKTKLNELSPRFKKKIKKYFKYGSEIVISQSYKNYKLFSKIEQSNNTDISKQENEIKNSTIDYIEIFGKKKRKQQYPSASERNFIFDTCNGM